MRTVFHRLVMIGLVASAAAGLSGSGLAWCACAPLLDRLSESLVLVAAPRNQEQDLKEIRKSLLSDPNAEKKFAAAQQLLRDHGDREFLVTNLLSSGEPAVREAIVRAFAVEEDDGLVRAALGLVARAELSLLVDRLHDYYDIINRVSAERLDETLLAVVKDPAAGDLDRLGAIQILGWVKCLGAVPVLINLIDPEAGVIVAKGPVLDALRAITMRDFGLEAGRWRAWWEANGSLGREQILEHYVKELERRSTEEREKLAARHREELAALEKRLSVSEKEVRDLAGRLLELEPQAVVRLLDHRDAQVRSRALEVARDLASRPERPKELIAEIHELLVRQLGDAGAARDSAQLAAMIDVLGKIGPDSDAARSVLIRYLEAGLEETVQAAAAGALRKGEDPQGVVAAALQRRLASVAGRPKLPITLVDALLKSVGARWKGGDPALLTQFLEMPTARASSGLRAEVCQQLGLIGDERAIPALAKVLVPPSAAGSPLGGDLVVRAAAAQALTDIGMAARKTLTPEDWRPLGARLLEVLGKGLDDPKPEVARQCIKHIAELAPDGALDLLAGRYQKDSQIAVVREELIRQIAALGGVAALPVLAQALVHEAAASAGGNGSSNGASAGGQAGTVDVVRGAIESACEKDEDRSVQLSNWSRVAVALLDLESPSLSVWALNRVLERFPVAGDEVPEGLDARLATRAQVRFQLALALARDGKNAEAHGHLTALTNEPGFPQIDKTSYYLALGRITQALGLWPQSAAAWEKVVGLVDEADQKHLDAQLRAAHAYLETATAEAAARANAILGPLEATCGQNSAYLYDAARAAQEIGEKDRALSLFVKLLGSGVADGSVERIDVIVRVCQLRLDRGEQDAARQLFEGLGDVTDLPDRLVTRLEDVRVRLAKKESTDGGKQVGDDRGKSGGGSVRP